MSQAKNSVRAAPWVIGVLLAWSIASVSPVFAQRSGGGGHRGGGGGHSGGGGFHGGGGMSAARGGPSHGPGISGGGGFSRGSGSFSRGTSHVNRGGIPGGGHYPGSSIPRGIAPTHAGPHYGRYPDSRYSHGGRVPSASSFHFRPYGYGYRFYSPGVSVYLDLPFYRSYDYYSRYAIPYYSLYTPPSVTLYPTVNSPLAVPIPSANAPVIAAAGRATEYQRLAEQAFREHRYDDAARLSSHAIVEDSQNGRLHLFASQTFYALGDFESAAAAIQQAASLLDRSDWGFVVENYRQFYRGSDYVTQTDRLRDFIKANPDASYAHFLLGYHYLFLGHKKAARKELSQAVALEARDQLATELLAMAGGAPPTPPEDSLPLPPPAEESTVPDSTAEPIPVPPPAEQG